MAKLTPMAIAYDFDGTLAPGNMQEYDFVPALNMAPAEFWSKAKKMAQEQHGDEILAYMRCMLEQARIANVPVRKKDFMDFGGKISFFEGVETWFARINQYAKEHDIKLEHFIISSGLREMVEGTKIRKNFSKIYASAFMYDNNNAACWPALAVNYTTKTQYLFRINKGSRDEFDNSQINKYVPPNKRDIPFANMIFIGDGETDIPCMRLVKAQGGHSIAVFNPQKRKGRNEDLGPRDKAKALVTDGRASLAVPANYNEDSELDQAVKAIINIVASNAQLDKIRK